MELKIIEWHREHGRNISDTSSKFNIGYEQIRGWEKDEVRGKKFKITLLGKRALRFATKKKKKL